MKQVPLFNVILTPTEQHLAEENLSQGELYSQTVNQEIRDAYVQEETEYLKMLLGEEELTPIEEELAEQNLADAEDYCTIAYKDEQARRERFTSYFEDKGL